MELQQRQKMTRLQVKFEPNMNGDSSMEDIVASKNMDSVAF